MRHITLLLLLPCLFLTACGSPQRTYVTQTQATHSLGEAKALPRVLLVPLTFEKGYLFVRGSVNGRPGGKMLLDTGSTLNIIDKGLVNRLALEQIGTGRTVGIAGTESFTTHRVESLAIGDLDLGADRAASMSMYKLMRGIRMSPGGLIGSVSLLPHPFTIDYARRELLVYNASTFVAPKDAERVRLEFYHGLPAVRATLANGQDALLIIDTGADNTISLPMQVSRWPGVLASGASGAGAASGVGGQIQTLRGWLKSVDVFGFKLSGVPVTFEPQAHEPLSDGTVVGRIGGQALKGFRMTFEARQRDLWVTFSGQAGQVDEISK